MVPGEVSTNQTAMSVRSGTLISFQKSINHSKINQSK
jgi:hypothetical protein